jgi:hypothetical protein
MILDEGRNACRDAREGVHRSLVAAVIRGRHCQHLGKGHPLSTEPVDNSVDELGSSAGIGLCLWEAVKLVKKSPIIISFKNKKLQIFADFLRTYGCPGPA